MKIFSSAQIRNWDKYTITYEPISSLDLMERAARAFYYELCKNFDSNLSVWVIAGTGNNGGDGLAVARMLFENGYDVKVAVFGNPEQGTIDFKANYYRLIGYFPPFSIDDFFKIINPQEIIVDALLGIGLNRKVEGELKEIILKLNNLKNIKISIDVPSGLPSDHYDMNAVCVNADYTYSFQCPKLAFLMEENEEKVGDWKVLDIGLSPDFDEKEFTNYYFSNNVELRPSKRKKHTHKGTYGYAALVAGSSGMMGAAVLAAEAGLRSGVGKLGLFSNGNTDIVQVSVPEAIIEENGSDFGKFDAIAIGPGIGRGKESKILLARVLKSGKPLVIDADAINLMSQSEDIKIPENTILTPHPKEFKNLLKVNWTDSVEKWNLLSDYCIQNQIYVCLKGHHTAIGLPDGSIHFNSTGNAGMATAGSGDVLTGIILGLLAQGFSPKQACIYGVYWHGFAGDRAAQSRSERSLIASDIIENLI